MYENKNLTRDECLRVEKLASEVKRQVEMYWSLWGKPMHYRDVFARFSQRLPMGMILLEFVSYCTQEGIIHVGMSTTGKRYVFPDLLAMKITNEDVMEHIIEMERTARARALASRRSTNALKRSSRT